ncbi:uncharacterized protein Z518_00488 [Rhinocladiella mackenziei CBS 650.93]|uniref:Uncharacterized protein n=1 Tax=Rhinocladiella mackenziei CBS 650.93 TaxID=1442369 RepID=A0A0D2HFD6_9EURO|nr:uncharacterized protein Z518_00488 [Rhinocladiella mackenziei CBS 650.93]KIX09408.1 hypothetical protein Z518_00488 [Rhinocladiella mackenziei CBS 650.93]
MAAPTDDKASPTLDDLFVFGLANRRAVVGDAFVDQALEKGLERIRISRPRARYNMVLGMGHGDGLDLPNEIAVCLTLAC